MVNPESDAFHYCRLSYTRIPHKHRVVLTPSAQNLYHPHDFFIPSYQGIKLALVSSLGYVVSELFKRGYFCLFLLLRGFPNCSDMNPGHLLILVFRGFRHILVRLGFQHVYAFQKIEYSGVCPPDVAEIACSVGITGTAQCKKQMLGRGQRTHQLCRFKDGETQNVLCPS